MKILSNELAVALPSGWSLAKSGRLIIIVLTLLALSLRVYGINYYSYGDEHYHIYNSLALATGQLPGNFHRIALFFFYGIFYFVGWMFGFFRDPAVFIGTYFSQMHIFYFVGRFFETLAGTACVPLLYLLGKKMFSRMTGFIAAFFLAVSPVSVEISQIARGQALCLLLIIVAMYFSYTAIDGKGKNLRYVFSGLCFGAALSIRIYVLIILIPLVCFYIKERSLFLVSQPGNHGGILRLLQMRIFSRLFLSLGLWLFIGFAILAYGVSAPRIFARFQPYVAGHIYDLATGTAEEKLYVGADVNNSFQYYLTEGLSRGLGLPLYIYCSLAIFIGLMKWRNRNYPALIFCVILYLAVMGRGAIAAVRYLFPLLPALFLVAGDVLSEGSRRFGFSQRHRNILIIVLVGIIAYPALSIVNNRNKLNRKPTTKDLAQEWIFSNLPDGTRIAVESMGYRGPDLKLTPVIDYWIYNLGDEDLRVLLNERIDQGQPSFALKHFIAHRPHPKYFTRTISIREVIDIRELIDEGYQYIVTCSGNRDVYEQEITRDRYPEHYASRVGFYQWLEKVGLLVKKFTPGPESPGDRIDIYKIR